MPRALLALAVREVFRRELIPLRLRWWFAAEGMGDWYRVLRRDLSPHVGGDARASTILSEISAPMFHRRHDLLHTAYGVPSRHEDPRRVGLVMGGLYRIASQPDSDWIFRSVGGGPSTFADHLRAERDIARLPLQARWEELTCHLGELLIALTERLPAHLPRARGILGDICFSAGERFGRKMKRAFELEVTPESALELLRMGEYIFRVNPEHWGEADAKNNRGWLEGTACPWYTAPGWNGAHCGIFGQFQSGISAVFGLRYHLTTTIPKNGGHTCRIDVKPILASSLVRDGARAGRPDRQDRSAS